MMATATMTPLLSSDIAGSVSSSGVASPGNDTSNAVGESRKRKDAPVSADITPSQVTHQNSGKHHPPTPRVR
jgi:hypothetical protein